MSKCYVTGVVDSLHHKYLLLLHKIRVSTSSALDAQGASSGASSLNRRWVLSVINDLCDSQLVLQRERS